MKRLLLLLMLLPFMAPVSATGQPDNMPPQTIAKEQRCPVCGMFPARYPKWRTQVIFKDKEMTASDSPADLFRFLQNLPRYDKKHVSADIAIIYVTDFESGEWVDAKLAYFVDGSSAKGPMNIADLPAFADRNRAEAFSGKKGGKVLGFDQVTPEVIKGLQQDHGHHDHKH